MLPATSAPSDLGKRPAAATAVLYLVCLATYMANGRPHPEVDCITPPYVAWSLVRHGSLDLSGYPDLERYRGTEVLQTAGGQWVSFRPIGTALVAAPLVAPLAVWHDQPPTPANMNHLGKLSAACCTAGAVALFHLLCRRLFPEAAWPATVLFAWGTCLWSVASQALWMHGPAVWWLTLALFLLLADQDRWTRIRLLLGGMALGLALLTRPTAAFFLPATLGVYLVRRRFWDALLVLLGALGPLALLAWLNLYLFGNVMTGGYGRHDDWSQATPLWVGLMGLLAAPSRGIFIYTPALVLAPLGLWSIRRHTPVAALLSAWTGACGATLLFYARWYQWAGGWCYGPRFLCETMPVLCLLFAAAHASLRTAWQRRGAEVLVAASVCVHLIGLAGYSGYENWQRRHESDMNGQALFSWHDTQIEAHARAAVAKLTRNAGR